MIPQTPRYSVCEQSGNQWIELLPTNSRIAALTHAATVPGAVVFDWKTSEQVTA
jgi:hypothetical protein